MKRYSLILIVLTATISLTKSYPLEDVTETSLSLRKQVDVVTEGESANSWGKKGSLGSRSGWPNAGGWGAGAGGGWGSGSGCGSGTGWGGGGGGGGSGGGWGGGGGGGWGGGSGSGWGNGGSGWGGGSGGNWPNSYGGNGVNWPSVAAGNGGNWPNAAAGSGGNWPSNAAGGWGIANGVGWDKGKGQIGSQWTRYLQMLLRNRK